MYNTYIHRASAAEEEWPRSSGVQRRVSTGVVEDGILLGKHLRSTHSLMTNDIGSLSTRCPPGGARIVPYIQQAGSTDLR